MCHYFNILCGLMAQENGKSRLQRTQEDVEEVKVIMLENLEKAEERKEKLSDLEDRADMLREQVSWGVSEKLWQTFCSYFSHVTGCGLCDWGESLESKAQALQFSLGTEIRKCYVDVYKYALGGGGEENKYRIYILIEFYGTIFRMVFPLVYQDKWSYCVSLATPCYQTSSVTFILRSLDCSFNPAAVVTSMLPISGYTGTFIKSHICVHVMILICCLAAPEADVGMMWAQ